MSKKELLWLLPIFAFVLILYFPVFGVYFSQDDFFHFKVSQTNGTIGAFVKLFGFPSFEERGYAFYRPIFREGLYNIYYLLFGLNVFPFRTLSLILHFLNTLLVYILIQKLFKKKNLSLFTAFFFGISTPNLAILYYLAGGVQILGATMFLLLSMIFFLKYLDGEGFRFKILSFGSFLLGLGSHENAVIIPIVLMGTIFVKSSIDKFIVRGIREVWPFFITLLVYLYLDVVIIGFLQKEEQYQVILSFQKTLNSFAWYSAWALGIPEMLIDFVQPGLKLNPSLMRYWGDFYSAIFTAFFFSIFFLGITTLSVFLKARNLFSDRRFWFFIFWFPLAIFPVIFLPLHKSTYYLGTALPAFWAIIGLLVFNAYWSAKKNYPRFSGAFLGGLLTSLVALSVFSVKIGESTFWAANRGRIAGRLVREVMSKYPNIPKESVVYFSNDPNYPFVAKDWGGTSKQAAFVLNKEDALQLLYKDPTLRVFYEDLGGVPSDFPRDRVYSLVAELK